MRKRKGAALPGAIILCTFLLIVSFGVSYMVVETITLSQLSKIEDDNHLIFSKSYNEFVASDGLLPSDTTFNWATYYNDGEPTVKALVASSKANNEMKFYTIYDFTNNKTIAYQTDEFYITSEIVGNKTTYYLAGLIPYREVIS